MATAWEAASYNRVSLHYNLRRRWSGIHHYCDFRRKVGEALVEAVQLQVALTHSFTMPFSSPFPDVEIPKCNLLDFLFPPDRPLSDTPIWIDAKETERHLTPRAMFQWTKKLALGLDKIGSKPGEVVMIHTPNHIFVPVAYLGIVGSKRIFSGANPAYTVPGKLS
jgi:hypothetical protein